MLQSKYVLDASLPETKLKSTRLKEHRVYNKLLISVNACFSQQMLAYKRFKEFGERTVVVMMEK